MPARIPTHRIGALIVACVIASLSSPIVAAQERALETFVPPSAFVVIKARPQSMLSQPAFELFPHELLKVFGEQELGLELHEITELLVVVDEIRDPSMTDPPDVGVVLKFAKPQQLGSKITDHLRPIMLADQQVYSDPRGEFALTLLGDQTTLVGGTVRVLEVILKEQPTGELAKLLAESPAEDHLNVIVHFESIREWVKSGLPPRDSVPPPLNEFLALPDLIKLISFRCNFSDDDAMELMVDANSDRDARRITNLIEKAIELGKGAALTGTSLAFNPSPEYETAMVAYAERLSEAIKMGLKPEVKGNRLVYDLNANSDRGAMLTRTSKIGIGIALILPAVQQVREAARRSQSMNNMRQLTLAMMNAEVETGMYPTQNSYDANGQPLLSWRVHLLPYLEEEDLYNEFKLDEPWNSEHNLKLLDRMPATYQNPNSRSGSLTQYLGVSGPNSPFHKGEKIGFKDFVRGTSSTALLVEVNLDQAVEWTRPIDWQVDASNPLRGLGSVRPGVFLAGFADGSTHTLAKSIDEELWLSMTQLEE